jgi:hypothetical protein
LIGRVNRIYPESTRVAGGGRLLLLMGLAVSGPGCALAAPPVAPVPPAAVLSYDPVRASPVAYSVTDTATFTVHAGPMGSMTVTSDHAGTATVELTQAGDSLEARVHYFHFAGSSDAEPHRRKRVDHTALHGAFHLRFDGRGRMEIVETPALSDDLLNITSPEALVRPLFVHLPGRPLDAGEGWVDTIRSVEEAHDVRTVARTVLTSTLEGDTIVDGRVMLLVRTRAENRIEVDGRSGGTPVRQRLSGTTLGTVVWDPQLNLLVERREEGHLTGTLDMPEAGVTSMPMTAAVRRTVSLVR